MTAGPTHEPIDGIRYIGNRSSGRLGVELADEGARRGWAVTLLLGPSALTPSRPEVELVRFGTAAELGALLRARQAGCDALVMAAAVADYRPAQAAGGGKLRRGDGPLTLVLEPTEDLLAACATRREPGQVLIGFALEPREGLLDSARAKLSRKGVDLIVANPLETMESGEIEAWLVGPRGVVAETGGRLSKGAFAVWLLERVEDAAARPQGA